MTLHAGPPDHSWTNPLHSAHSAGVLLLNEIGLDPGIDHCSAHSLLSRLRSENKQVVSFTSFCGGLPAPEVAGAVPLGYKFSWSPRGVLRATSESASFRLAGQVRSSGHHLPVPRVQNLISHNSVRIGKSRGRGYFFRTSPMCPFQTV